MSAGVRDGKNAMVSAQAQRRPGQEVAERPWVTGGPSLDVAG